MQPGLKKTNMRVSVMMGWEREERWGRKGGEGRGGEEVYNHKPEFQNLTEKKYAARAEKDGMEKRLITTC